jgi:hypothetical protein
MVNVPLVGMMISKTWVFSAPTGTIVDEDPATPQPQYFNIFCYIQILGYSV